MKALYTALVLAGCVLSAQSRPAGSAASTFHANSLNGPRQCQHCHNSAVLEVHPTATMQASVHAAPRPCQTCH